MTIMMNHGLEQRNEQNKNIRGGGRGGKGQEKSTGTKRLNFPMGTKDGWKLAVERVT